MKSVPTPWTHTGRTVEPLTIAFGPSGGHLKHTVTVPAGTRCHLLEGGGAQPTWVVADLSFIKDKRDILYSDADIYGIRVPHDKITRIRPVDDDVLGSAQRRESLRAELSTNTTVPLGTLAEAEETILDLLEQREKLLHALYTALPFVEDAAHDPCFKPGHAKKVERGIRDVLESIEHAMKVPSKAIRSRQAPARTHVGSGQWPQPAPSTGFVLALLLEPLPLARNGMEFNHPYALPGSGTRVSRSRTWTYMQQ